MSGTELPDLPSTESTVVPERAYAALHRTGELLVAYYVAYGGGWNEWHLVHTPDEFAALLRSTSKRSAFDIYLPRQLPIRGTAGPATEADALLALRKDGEVLLARRATGRSLLAHLGTLLEHFGADEEADVREWFTQHAGEQILARPHPATTASAAAVLNARVPDPDGRVRSAAF